MAISSRKQYIQVSDAIAKVRAAHVSDIESEFEGTSQLDMQLNRVNKGFDHLVNLLCETYSKDNPSFDAARFRKACGYAS